MIESEMEPDSEVDSSSEETDPVNSSIKDHPNYWFYKQYGWGLTDEEEEVEAEPDVSVLGVVEPNLQTEKVLKPRLQNSQMLVGANLSGKEVAEVCSESIIHLSERKVEHSMEIVVDNKKFKSVATQTVDPPSGFLRIIRIKEGNRETETRTWVNIDGSEMEARFHLEILRNATLNCKVVEAAVEGDKDRVVNVVPVKLSSTGGKIPGPTEAVSMEIIPGVSVSPGVKKVEFDGKLYPEDWFVKPYPESVHQHLRPKGCFNCFKSHLMRDCKEAMRIYCFVCSLPGYKYPDCPCCHIRPN